MSPIQMIQNFFILLKTHMFKLIAALIILVFMQYMLDFMIITHRFFYPSTTFTPFYWPSFWKAGLNISLYSFYQKGNLYIIPRQAYSQIMTNKSKKSLQISSQANYKFCSQIPPNLVGRLKIITDVLEEVDLEKLIPNLDDGGCFKPKDCKARQKVAIIIPYRNREDHLKILLRNLHPILQRQQNEYCIFVIEQVEGASFNRAKLLNIGYQEALSKGFTCFIFHDVDLISEDDRNIYKCSEQPRHMSVAVSNMNYELPYKSIFGGVSALTKNQMIELNGFSNEFWGWGGEDDDMSNRIKFHGFKIIRYPAEISRYTMLDHKKQAPNPSRYKILLRGRSRFRQDGLSNLESKKRKVVLKKLYTWVLVDPLPPESAKISFNQTNQKNN